MLRSLRAVSASFERSAFAGVRFRPEVILLAVLGYLRYGLLYCDVEELLGERGIEVDYHVTIYQWVQRITPVRIDAEWSCRDAAGGRWFVDETYVKVVGRWRYVCRAVGQQGQVIDVYVSARGEPDAVVAGLAQVLETVIEESIPDVFHEADRYGNNRVECDRGRLKARLRPVRGLKTDRGASVAII